MTRSSFYEEGSKLLKPGAFQFVLDSELKRAVRLQNYLTLVVVEARREWEGMTVTADEGTLQDVAQIIGRETRDTDLLAHTDEGTLTLVCSTPTSKIRPRSSIASSRAWRATVFRPLFASPLEPRAVRRMPSTPAP